MFDLLTFQDGQVYETKVTAGKVRVPFRIKKDGDILWLKFAYNKELIPEVKVLEGARWNPEFKQWYIPDTEHNRFRLTFMEGNKDPYQHYDKPLIDFKPSRNLYNHQKELTSHVITRLYCHLSSEMGTGKTLAIIEAMEWLLKNRNIRTWFYVAPKSALTSVQLEFEKWRALVYPQFFTYEKLVGILAKWPEGAPPPEGVIFDEASRLKTPGTQRSKAAYHLAKNIRNHWKERGAVVLMSGSPAPKSPLDWWFQLQIACPGYIREGKIEKFRDRLGIIKVTESESGGAFPQLVTWRDDESKCAVCGQTKEFGDHDEANMAESWFHAFTPGKNEVAALYRRMKGLVIVKFKKDCLDLPEKQYRVIQCKPNQDVLNAAKLLTAKGLGAAATLILLRELSDGFQYQDLNVGKETCERCKGNRTVTDFAYVGPEDEYEEVRDKQSKGIEVSSEYFQKVEQACNRCHGTGEQIRWHKETKQVPCPKEDALIDLIDQHDDAGRLVCYAGFTGSVDRCCNIFAKQDWQVIRVDGRGWYSGLEGNSMELLKKFQYGQDLYKKVAFVGQPGAAGMGLNLTASPSIIYYSNDFNAESRIQSEDRIHRPGMNVNRGATIFDILHLPTDQLVLDNLKKKRRLQDISMGEFKSILEAV